MSVKFSQININEFAKVYRREVEKHIASGERGCRSAIASQFNGMEVEDVSSIASQLRKLLKANNSPVVLPMLPGKGRSAKTVDLSALESILSD